MITINLDLNNTSEECLMIPRILIIEKDDELPLNPHFFKMERYKHIYIHKDNKYKEEFKTRTLPTRCVLGGKIVGTWCEYVDNTPKDYNADYLKRISK